jgi:hypothetical protein
MLSELKTLAVEKFKEIRPSPYGNMAESDVPDFIDLLREIYDSTIDSDTELRNATASIFKDHQR